MAASRSSSSSQIEMAPTTTMIAASSTPNTGATGLTVPAPSAPSQPPASCMNLSAFWAALWPTTELIQSLALISSWARAGPTNEKTAATGRYTKAERIACMPSARTTDWATDTSRNGSATMTASASMMRYWDTNQPALITSGEVVLLIRPPTFSRNHSPAEATALVKLRSALSPAVAARLPAAWLTAPPAAPTGLVPVFYIFRRPPPITTPFPYTTSTAPSGA